MNFQNKSLKEIVKNKKVLFITTKNIDYIRNTQEIRILRKLAQEVEVISSDKKNYVFRVLSVWMQIKKSIVQQYDVVFVGFSPQLVVPFVGRRFRNKLLVIDFFISVYDTLICDRKKFKDGGLIAKLCHLLDEKTIRKADHVITDTNAHAEYFISEFCGNSDIFETIYLEADPTIYYPRPQNKPEELKDKFVVLYFGSILPLQGIDVVLDAIRVLKDQEDIFFDIIGPIPEKYKKPIQDNIGYTEWLPQEKLAEHIANADICLAGHFSGDIDKAKRTIPGKAYIYRSMDRPMILGDNSANRELYAENDKICFVQMGNPDAIANLLAEIKMQTNAKHI